MTNIRKLPAQKPRVETGVTQFGEDLPGVFIRGDNAFGFRKDIAAAINLVGYEDPQLAERIDLILHYLYNALCCEEKQ